MIFCNCARHGSAGPLVDDAHSLALRTRHAVGRTNNHFCRHTDRFLDAPRKAFARVLRLGAADPELALPTMAVELLPGIFVGMILAGIFAATMSTADSLVLSCSAALTHDLLPKRFEASWEMKAATALVTALALGVALTENRSVFSLVILAWSTLASAFGPLLTIYALGRRISERGAIAAMIAGVAVALAWRWAGWHTDVYEGMPGILVGLLVAAVMSRPKEQPAAVPAPDAAALSKGA